MAKNSNHPLPKPVDECDHFAVGGDSTKMFKTRDPLVANICRRGLGMPHAWGAQLLRGLGKRRPSTPPIQRRLALLGHEFVHHWRISIPLDMSKETLMRPAPGHCADVGATEEEALEVVQGTSGFVIVYHVYKAIAQASHLLKIDRNVHKVEATVKATLVEKSYKSLTQAILRKASKDHGGQLVLGQFRSPPLDAGVCMSKIRTIRTRHWCHALRSSPAGFGLRAARR